MKRGLSLFLSLTIAFLIITVSVPVAFAAEYSGACGSGVLWDLDTYTGELVVYGSGDMKNYSAESAPSWSPYQNYIKNVIISDGVTSVGAYAFYNISGYKYQKLTTVTMSSSVETIGSYAFRGCKALTTVIGAGVETIGDYAFRNCEKLSVFNLSAVVSAGNGAFSYCTGITDLPFPPSLTTIGPSAFKGCSGIASLVFPDTIKSLGSQAFAECTGLTYVEFLTPELTSRSYSVFGASGADSGMNVAIGSNVVTIPEGLFENCTNLDEVTISNGVKTIGEGAFYSSGVTTVNIPASVTSISSDAFAFCNRLESFSVNSSNTVYSTGTNGELMNKNRSTLYRYPSGKTDFSYSTPVTVKVISDAAFLGDDDLETITTTNVTTVNSRAFSMCVSLESVSLPKATALGSYAFADSDNLIEVSAPKVTTIEEHTFFGCDSFYGDLSGFSSLKAIADYAFSNVQGLETVTIPSTVTGIGTYAFNNCDNLSAVTIPSSVININEGAFLNCDNLMTVNLSEGLKKVYRYAFLGCPALLSVKIPSTVTTVGDYAFGYIISGSSYKQVSGFTLYCYNGTQGHIYAQNNSSNSFTYQVVTDSVGEDIVVPDETIDKPTENTDVFTIIVSFIRTVFDFIISLI